MQNLAPIALFVYNRPDHTRRTITYLQKNLLAEESRLYIFSDAPKKDEDRARVDEVRQLIKEVSGFKSVKVIERQHNLGLAESIISGVTQLVNEYDKVIVFEDDLLSSPYTLQYFNEALDRYKNEDKVMHIGAYMYPLDYIGLEETFFSTIVTSWGWATWKRSWNVFEKDVNKLLRQFEEDKTQRKTNEFSFNGKMNFYKQLKELKKGQNNSWAIRWYGSVYLNGGLSLNPSKSLINNIGFDFTGTHSNNETRYQTIPSQKVVKKFPSNIENNRRAYIAMENFLSGRKGGYRERIIRYMEKLQMKYLGKVFVRLK